MMLTSLLMGGVLMVTLPAQAEGECDVAKVYNEGGWCSSEDAGYFNCMKIASRKLYDALQGKYTSSFNMTNEAQKEAFHKDEWSEEAGEGYVVYKAYRSKVAYWLAKGRSTDPTKIEDEFLKKASQRFDWSDEQKVGMVGCAKFKDKDQYENARKAREILEKAIETAATDEDCAVAMVMLATTEGDCETLKSRYREMDAPRAAKEKAAEDAAKTDAPEAAPEQPSEEKSE